MSYGFGCAIVVDSQGSHLRHLALGQSVRRHFRQGRQAAGNLEQGVRRKGRLRRRSRSPPPPTACTGARKARTSSSTGPKTSPAGKDHRRSAPASTRPTCRARSSTPIGNVDKESSTSQKFDFTNPTDVAVAANGDIYVVDGYGSQLLYRFDKNFKLIKTIGGPGKEHGKFNTCHGVWINTLKARSPKSTSPTAPTTASRSTRSTWSTSGRSRTSAAVLLLPARRPALHSGTGLRA